MAYTRPMKHLVLLASFLFACGGGSSKPAQEPAPAPAAATTDVNATAKVEAKVETPPVAPPAPVVAKVPPKIVLGAEAKISMKLDFDKEGKAESDIVIAADGKA